MLLEEHELHTFPEHLSLSTILVDSCCQSFSFLFSVLQIAVCPFLYLLTILLPVLRLTAFFLVTHLLSSNFPLLQLHTTKTFYQNEQTSHKITLHKNKERTLHLPNISYFQQLLNMPASTYAMQFCQLSINCFLHDVELQHSAQILHSKSSIFVRYTFRNDIFYCPHSSIHYIKESILKTTNDVSLFDLIMQIRH